MSLPGLAAILAGISGRSPLSVAYTATDTSSVSGTSYTFSSKAIGTAAADRYIVIAISSNGSSSNPTASSVTVAGTSCTKTAADTDLAAGPRATIALWITNSPIASGTTADIAITYGSTNSVCSIGVWAVYGITSATPTATKNAKYTVGSTTTFSAALSLPTDGIVIAAEASSATSATNISWSIVTEDFDAAHGSYKLTGGSLNNASGSVTPASTGTTRNGGFVAASWS